MYDRLDAELAYALMSINAVKGVEIGSGFASVAQKGTEHGDEMTPQGFLSNNAGGVLGGISTGQDIVASIAVKPTSSIRLDRHTVDSKGNAVIVNTHGRHDPCVGIRATPIARSDAGAGADGSRATPSCTMRRCSEQHAQDSCFCKKGAVKKSVKKSIRKDVKK